MRRNQFRFHATVKFANGNQHLTRRFASMYDAEQKLWTLIRESGQEVKEARIFKDFKPVWEWFSADTDINLTEIGF